jgi:hypothetical protein
MAFLQTKKAVFGAWGQEYLQQLLMGDGHRSTPSNCKNGI